MTLHLLYARIPIELHELELDRICAAYRRELCSQLQQLASEVAQHDLIEESELQVVQAKTALLDKFISPTELETQHKSNVRRVARANLVAALEPYGGISKQKASTETAKHSDGRKTSQQPSPPPTLSSSSPTMMTSDTDNNNSNSNNTTQVLDTHVVAKHQHHQQQQQQQPSTSTWLRPESVVSGRRMQRQISFVDDEEELTSGTNKAAVQNEVEGRDASQVSAAVRHEPSSFSLAFASTTLGGTSTKFVAAPSATAQPQIGATDMLNSSTESAGTVHNFKRPSSVTFDKLVDETKSSDHGNIRSSSSNSNNNSNNNARSGSISVGGGRGEGEGGGIHVLSASPSRRPSVAQLMRKASLINNEGSRRPSSVFSQHPQQQQKQNQPLFVPESSAVKTAWVQQLEETYLRAVGRREELIHQLGIVADFASGPNTMKCISSTMWPEIRQTLNNAVAQQQQLQQQQQQQQQQHQQPFQQPSAQQHQPPLPPFPQILPTAVRTIFATDGGLAAGVEESTIQVPSLPLIPHSTQTWDELGSDANPKPPSDLSTWDMPAQKDVDDYFGFMDKTPTPANPFTPLVEIMRYELCLFDHAQKHKRPPAMLNLSRDKIVKSTIAAKRALQDAIAKLERLEALYNKEVSDFLSVCRALQKLYIREKRDADAAIALYERHQQTLEQLAVLRAATIVDDEEFAAAGGRRLESPDITIGRAEMRHGTMFLDVGVRCRIDQSTLLEELDRMMLDTSLRHNRIKRFVDYVDDFVERIARFDDEVDRALSCPVCRAVSTELCCFVPCGCVYCVNCIPQPEESAEGEAYGAFCKVCGTSSKESYVPNFNASSIAARVRFRHAGCSELSSDAAKLRGLVLGSSVFASIQPQSLIHY